jgi:hypothetical protein
MSYLRVGFATTINILLAILTSQRFLWLEGRVVGGVFSNWIKLYRYRPRYFEQPESEEEIISLIKNRKRLRVFGSGHSFNNAIVGETLISLDKYSGVVWINLEKKQMAVRGGTRVRDVVQELLAHGMALAAQPSHDAQSIGGILSTDVHGTGRDWGFVSESVVSLKFIDGRGQIHECFPEDDLFKAVIGGIGAMGIIIEVVIQAVERFNVRQAVQISTLADVEQNLDRLLQENEHFSFYAFPFTDKCQINTWNRTVEAQSMLGVLREQINISLDSLGTSWIANFLAYSGLLPALSTFLLSFKRDSNLVLESSQAYNRTIYPLHHELEFAIPYEQTFTVLRMFMKLYEHQQSNGLPAALIEVRFTPDGHERSLIGPGRQRKSAWIDLIYNDSLGEGLYFIPSEALMMAIGGRPHLGKWTKRTNRRYMAYVHGEHFEHFRRLIKKHDPQGKFVNGFTRRLFEPDSP